jgi:outer membrane protein assembly factor BamB
MHALLLFLCSAVSGDWPQFRGPDSNAIVDGRSYPLEWSDSKNVVWKTGIAGLGWSSPAVRDDRVFLTTAVTDGDSVNLHAIGINTATGDVIWDREIRRLQPAPAIHAKNSHASPTPIAHDDSVFVHFGSNGVYRLSATDGSIQWACMDLVYPPVHGCGGSPVLHNGKLFIVCDGSSDPFVAAIDASTGTVLWRTLRSEHGPICHSFGTPVIGLVDGRPQLFAPGPGHFAAYDPETGAELWKVLAPGWSVVPQPAIGHGLVIYNHDYDHPELIAVRPGGFGNVTDSAVVWRLQRGAPSTPSPLLIGDELYFVNDEGVASCVDGRTGRHHWMERLGGNFSASPVFVNGRILFLNETGLATWVQPGLEFKALGTSEVPGRTFATPAFADGAMYLRTDTVLYKFQQER